MAKSRNPATASSVDEIATVRMELLGSDPLIWREVEVPTSITLKVLHDVIQIAMGWFDHHLWEFIIDKRRYGLSMDEDWGTEPREEAARVRLRDVLKPRRTKIGYTYDFGDDWQVRLTVSNVRLGDPLLPCPRLLGGERNGPPEDCGGIPGFYHMLEALADPEHPDHDEATERADDYDPDDIDEPGIRFGLLRLSRRRNAARARAGKKNRPGDE